MSNPDNKIIVAVGRQYGSGGREIALKLAEELGVPFYDKKLIAMAAERSGLSSQLLHAVDEQAMSVYMQASSAAAAAARGDDSDQQLSLNDQLFQAQADIIRQLAADGSCVIVGRTADHILRDMPGLIRIFVHAPLPYRVKTVMDMYGQTEEEARQTIETYDRERAHSYARYTGGTPWGQLECFDLAIDSSLLGWKGTTEQLLSFIEAVRAARAES